MGGEGRLDLCKHVVWIGEYLFIQEAQDSPATLSQKRVAFQIMPILRPVLAAVGFDDEARRDRSKVGDVRRDRMLATEVPAREVRVMQNLPQRMLCLGLIAVEVTRSVAVECGQVWH